MNSSYRVHKVSYIEDASFYLEESTTDASELGDRGYSVNDW
jgi:hypothetical protein